MGIEWVKRFDLAWLEREPDLVEREAGALALLGASDFAYPVPRVLSVEHDTVVMTRLPGQAHWDPPSIERLAEIAPALHAVVPPDGFRRYRRYYGDMGRPAWSSQPLLWERALEVAAATEVDWAHACFIHRDHHAGNVLWVAGEVSGVIDFVEACVGPPEIDAARMRLNLARHVGLDAAAAYARRPGIVVDPRWDIVDACDSAGSPRARNEWVEPFVAAALAELG